MTDKDKVVQLRILLLKSDFKKDADILRDNDTLHTYPVSTEVPFKGTLYVRPQFTNPPTWLSYVKPHVAGDISKLRNASTAAVLLLDAAKRKFAITFGYGRNLLNAEAWQRDFGLKVALNRVDPDTLKSIDCRNFEEVTLHTRRQASRGSGLDTFGLNVTQDLVRQVVGVPKDKSFARRLAGSDGLMIAVPLAFNDLGKKCAELLDAYHDTAYKERFEFIDNLHFVRDPTRISALNELLIEALKNGTHEQMHLAPPELIDAEAVDGFTYSARQDAEVYVDLELTDLLKEIASAGSLTVGTLRHTKIGVRYSSAGQSDMKWTGYQCLVFETEHEDRLYVLTCGDWFEIEKTFVNKVQSRVKQIASTTSLTLPEAKIAEKEAPYNSRVAQQAGYVLLDQKCSRAVGTPIEPCDLFTPAGQFIHVKRKTRSATLSHLFAQGVISADCFVGDQQFRKDLRKLIEKANKKLEQLVPDGRPRPDQYEVIYAVVTKDTKTWPASLPFFSQLNLMNAADHLERLTFKVSLLRVKQI